MSKNLIRHIALIGVGVYLLALIIVSLVFRNHAMQLKWMLWGIGEVLFFFLLTTFFYPRWKKDDQKHFLRKVFWTALALRAVYAFVMCYYFYYQTGIAFEYQAGDSLGYHRTAVYLSRCIRAGHIRYVFQYLNAYTMGFSDQGYTLWLAFIYTIFGPNLLTPRLLKALMSAYMCVALYKLTFRTFGERTARLVTVMCVFMPTLIQITGLHTKETEMTFLTVMALERMDYLVRSRRYTFWTITAPILFTALTFGFRTIIGMSLIFAFIAFIVLSEKLVTRKQKIGTIAAIVLVFFVFLFTPVGREMKIIYRLNFTEGKMVSKKYEALGLKHAQLVKNRYMAPGVFVIPLSSMVEEANENQKMMNGSYYVKNLLAFFAMWAIVIAIREKRWRNFTLVGGFELAYLGIIAFSFAVNSERYHQPALPCLIIMAAFCMTHLRRKDLKLYYVYCGLLLLALIGWNWMKLSARGFY